MKKCKPTKCYECREIFTEWKWGPHWCLKCDKKRVDRISESLKAIGDNFSRGQNSG